MRMEANRRESHGGLGPTEGREINLLLPHLAIYGEMSRVSHV